MLIIYTTFVSRSGLGKLKGLTFVKLSARIWIMKKPFVLAVFLTVCATILFYPRPGFIEAAYKFNFVLTFLVLFLIFLLMANTNSLKRSLIFFALSVFIAFGAEAKGVNLDHKFVYAPVNLELFRVPISIITWWGIFISLCYCFTNTFLAWTKNAKPSLLNKGSFKFIPLMVVIDALLVSSIGLLVEPLGTYLGNWRWFSNSAYFGVPLADFRGWFLVSGLCCLIIRVFEYYFPVNKKADYWAHLLVVLLFAFLNLNFARIAAGYGLTGVALVGIYVTLPLVFVNLMLFLYRKPPSTK